MAAAVMRAMTFGLADKDKDKDREREGRRSSRSLGAASGPGRSGSGSRSSSRTGFARAFGAGGDDDSDDEGVARSLSRTSSRLQPVSAGPGILLNTTRSPLPSPSTSPPTGSAPNGSLYVTPSAASSRASGLDLSRPLSSPSVSPPVHPGVGRRQHSDASSTYPVTPVNGTFPPHSTLGATPSSSGAGTKRESTIRFAPLPEIRPRSYSTGRNVWLEDAEYDDDGLPLDGERHFVRRDDAEGVEYDDYALDDEDEPGSGAGGGALQKWGSWSDSLAGWALSPVTSRNKGDDDAHSTTGSVAGEGYALERTTSGASSVGGASTGTSASGGGGSAGGGGSSKKLLKAFGFGKSGSSASSSAAGKKAERRKSTAGDETGLSRTLSASSEPDGPGAARRLSLDVGGGSGASPATPRPKGSTGIPMRKSSTWEPGDSLTAPAGRSASGAPVYYASPARSARRRSNYPPVAQRSRNAPRVVRRVEVEEPAFEEWGSASSVGAVGGSRGGKGARSAAGAEEDDDDGSGMAWIKKRRAEREKKEREERERAEAQAATAPEEGGADEPAELQDHELPPVSPALSSASAPAASASPPPEDGSTADDAAPAEGEPRRPFLPSGLAGRSPPQRSATLDSTISTASTIRPSTPVPSQTQTQGQAQHKPSGLSTTRPVLSVDVDAAPITRVEPSSASPSDAASVRSPTSASTAETSDDEEDEEDEESDEDEDDLDAEELAREEALVEEAKRGAKSMGAERYHSAAHENRLLQVKDAPAQAQGAGKAPKASPRLN
ncbi:hypothetical protein JCM10207_007444 [Rhodosporidiobolus poonsookiae]